MKILIAYDGSTSADAAVEDLRKAGLPPQTEALVVCVQDGTLHPSRTGEAEPAPPKSWKESIADAEALARKAHERVERYFPNWKVSSEGMWGSPPKMILERSASWHPDLIVVGSHGRSRLASVVLGSVSLELIHKATCSMRVVRSREGTPGEGIRIIIGHDGSEGAEAAIRSVAGRSWPDKTEAQIVSVVQSLVPAAASLETNIEPAYTMINESQKRERARLQTVAEQAAATLRAAGLIVTSSVSDGDPAKAILAEAEHRNADAIFVGASGHGRVERLLLGSVSTHVVTHAKCTVEVARPSRENQDHQPAIS